MDFFSLSRNVSKYNIAISKGYKNIKLVCTKLNVHNVILKILVGLIITGRNDRYDVRVKNMTNI